MANADVNLLGIDETTTARALAVRRQDGGEGFATRAMIGNTAWNGDDRYPAFDLSGLPRQVLSMLDELAAGGYPLATAGERRLSIACRQHDLVLLDKNGQFLTPAISWQCNAAVQEAAAINQDASVVDVVGTVEPRLILPKLIHLLHVEPTLADRIWLVMTTGDWVAYMLTGEARLHTSEAMSNGLIDRRSLPNARLPEKVLLQSGLRPEWFPPLIESGRPVGVVGGGSPVGLTPSWRELRERLAGWEFIAGLGDNHASAVGCGVRGSRALLTSMGTSGTNNWVHRTPPRTSEILGFGYYQDFLWLTMLGDCGAWYNRFLREYAHPFQDDHELWNRLACQVDIAEVVRVPYFNGELYRSGWTCYSHKVKVASVQFSIAFELLWRIRMMLRAMDEQGLERPVDYVLTGGLSQSSFLREVYSVGVRYLAGSDRRVLVSGRMGPLRYKTTAYGALINAEFYGDLARIPADRFPTLPCDMPDEQRAKKLSERLHQCFQELEKAGPPPRIP